MESGEHMPDKQKFLNELFRVTAPNGRIIIVTWCHRELAAGEQSLQKWELQLLNRISKAYYLPQWVPASEYVKIAEELGLEDIRTEDWSEYVLPFWPAVIRSALNPRNFIKMILSGMVTIKGAIASVSLCYSHGLILTLFLSSTVVDATWTENWRYQVCVDYRSEESDTVNLRQTKKDYTDFDNLYNNRHY